VPTCATWKYSPRLTSAYISLMIPWRPIYTELSTHFSAYLYLGPFTYYTFTVPTILPAFVYYYS
jgi:hypothetical protein